MKRMGAASFGAKQTGTRKAAAEEKQGLTADGDEQRSAESEGLNVEDARRLCPSTNDLKWVDQFPYVPSYRFHPYRSVAGATCSLLLGFVFFLRMVSSTMDFVDLPPVVTESREQFPRDSTEQYTLPRIGVQFRENGWRPFNDPRYMQINFDQGVIQRSGNITYTQLGSRECAFVDKDGRLIADDARCPRTTGHLQGDFHDVTFAFVRAKLVRCDNGTDSEGKPLPGMCAMPHEIDRLVYEGVLYMFEQETDMRVNDNAPFLRIRQWRREFVTGTHISSDIYFTVRKVTQEARYIFDAYLPGFSAGFTFMLLDDYQETYTDFDEVAAQYAAFYFRLAPEMIRQRRSYTSLFALFESWGASGAFLFVLFGLTAQNWNAWRFNRQVAGLDIRKLDRAQFTQHGRLIDKSFQMPREFQCMSAE